MQAVCTCLYDCFGCMRNSGRQLAQGPHPRSGLQDCVLHPIPLFFHADAADPSQSCNRRKAFTRNAKHLQTLQLFQLKEHLLESQALAGMFKSLAPLMMIVESCNTWQCGTSAESIQRDSSVGFVDGDTTRNSAKWGVGGGSYARLAGISKMVGAVDAGTCHLMCLIVQSGCSANHRSKTIKSSVIPFLSLASFPSIERIPLKFLPNAAAAAKT